MKRHREGQRQVAPHMNRASLGSVGFEKSMTPSEEAGSAQAQTAEAKEISDQMLKEAVGQIFRRASSGDIRVIKLPCGQTEGRAQGMC